MQLARWPTTRGPCLVPAVRDRGSSDALLSRADHSHHQLCRVSALSARHSPKIKESYPARLVTIVELTELMLLFVLQKCSKVRNDCDDGAEWRWMVDYGGCCGECDIRRFYVRYERQSQLCAFVHLIAPACYARLIPASSLASLPPVPSRVNSSTRPGTTNSGVRVASKTRLERLDPSGQPTTLRCT